MEVKKNKAVNFENSFSRLIWRFKNPNVKANESKFIINETDIESIDFLIKWINNQKQNTLNDNELFAKLFCYMFYNEIVFYKGEPSFALKKVEEQLKMPIEYHYSKIHNILNTYELRNYMDSIGVSDKHPLLRTDEEEKQNISLFKKHNPDIVKKIYGTWSIESVYKSLNNSITELINKYKNYK